MRLPEILVLGVNLPRASQGVFNGDLDKGKEPVRADIPSFWDGPSFAYSLPVHSLHMRRDRVASLTTCRFAWRGHTKRLATRARPSPDLSVRLE